MYESLQNQIARSGNLLEQCLHWNPGYSTRFPATRFWSKAPSGLGAAECCRLFSHIPWGFKCQMSQGFPRCIDRWCLCLRLSCDREIQPGSWMAQRLTLEDDWGCTKMHKGVGRCTDLQSGIKSSIEVAPNKSCASPFCWWQPNGSKAVTRAWHIV
jgi:hypothetical protein